MRILAAGTLLALVASSAMASPTTYTLTDGTAGLTTGDLTGHISYSGTPYISEDVYIGALNMTVTPSNGSAFQQSVFCTDIFNEFVLGGVYDLSTTSLATSIGTTKANQINALLFNAPDNDSNQNAAIQASIWEIINEPGTSGYSLTSGEFQVSNVNSTFFADASTDLHDTGVWLANSNAVLDQYIVAAGQGANQSFTYIGIGQNQHTNGVPEPNTLGIFLMGLVVLTMPRWMETFVRVFHRR